MKIKLCSLILLGLLSNISLTHAEFLDLPIETINIPAPNNHMQALEDNELQDITAQALFELSQNINSSGTQFLKLIVNSSIDINANIRHLNLGDQIDLEYVSLTGDTRDPTSAARIIRPFVELAMNNYDDEAARELIGLRIGAESMNGRLSIGKDDNTTGLNRFRGYIETTPIIAQGQTNAKTDYPGYQGLQYTADEVTIRAFLLPITLRNVPIEVDVCLGVQANRCDSAGNPIPSTTAYIDASQNYALTLDSSVVGQFNSVNGLKIASGDITVNGIQDVYSKIEIGDTSQSNVADGGYLIARTDPLTNLFARADGSATALISLDVGANTDISQVNINEIPIHLEEDLTYFHDIILDDDGFFISLQSEQVCWEGSRAANCSQAGYWFEISQPVDLGSLELDNIDVPNSAVDDIVEALAPYLETAEHNGTLFDLQNIQVDVTDTVELYLDSFNTPVSQQNLDVLNQRAAVNCYGGIDCF